VTLITSLQENRLTTMHVSNIITRNVDLMGPIALVLTSLWVLNILGWVTP